MRVNLRLGSNPRYQFTLQTVLHTIDRYIAIERDRERGRERESERARGKERGGSGELKGYVARGSALIINDGPE